MHTECFLLMHSLYFYSRQSLTSHVTIDASTASAKSTYLNVYKQLQRETGFAYHMHTFLLS